jgi:predicted PurR-regulated permease PerM
VIFASVLIAIGAFAALVIPSIVNQVNDFVQAVPTYIQDLTHGRGPLGFLETRFHVVERVKQAVGAGGGSKLLSHVGVLLSVGKGIATATAAVLTIIVLSLFMLLEGPAWVERLHNLLPEDARPRWRRVGQEIYRTIGGYVSGNLLISLICGVIYALALVILGVPYPVALGFIAAILDLVPLAGATIAGIIVCGASFATSTTAGIVMVVVVIVYQQVENHLLQPIIYGRTVDLSPLAVLIAVLVGAQVAGVLGALGAIPIAGTLQVFLLDHLEHRRARRSAALAGAPAGDGSAIVTS